MRLEITAEGGGIVGSKNVSGWMDEWFLRYFWKEGLSYYIKCYLPHAHVEILNLKVSEK